MLTEESMRPSVYEARPGFWGSCKVSKDSVVPTFDPIRWTCGASR